MNNKKHNSALTIQTNNKKSASTCDINGESTFFTTYESTVDLSHSHQYLVADVAVEMESL